MGSGVGFWALNLESLCKDRTVHAFDVLGFGQSSRPKFPKDAMKAEEMFVESFEEWRKTMNLDKFILLGHSMGGFLSSAYALQYSQHIKHLILADSWGYTEQSDSWNPPAWVRPIVALVMSFNPFSGLRAAGPWGKLALI